jgi:hypothetical protein
MRHSSRAQADENGIIDGVCFTTVGAGTEEATAQAPITEYPWGYPDDKVIEI